MVGYHEFAVINPAGEIYAEPVRDGMSGYSVLAAAVMARPAEEWALLVRHVRVGEWSDSAIENHLERQVSYSPWSTFHLFGTLQR